MELVKSENSFIRNQRKTKNKRDQIIYIIFFTIALVGIEYLLRNILTKLTFLISTHSKSIVVCDYFEYFDFYNVSGRYFFLFFLYNFVNVYAALSLVFLDSTSVFINGIIRFFYLDPRPFWSRPDLPPCFCAIDYGNPSTTGINMFIISVTIYKALTSNFINASHSKSKKVLIAVLCTLMVAYIFVIRVLQNIHFIYQLLYGMGIGYIICYIFFEILEVDFSNEEQFRYILSRPVLITIVSVTVFVLTNVVHYFLVLDNPNKEYYLKNINKYCEINEIFSFDHESYTKSTRIFEFLGYYFGIYLEYLIVFKFDYESFAKYNIDSKYEMFNRTSIFKTIIRIILMFESHTRLISLLILSKYQKSPDESIFYSMIVRLCIPYFIEGIFNFFLLKIIMKYIYLTNEIMIKNYKQLIDKA